MKKRISARRSGQILLTFLLLLILFHLLILLRIVPYEIVWGGQIANTSSLIMLECMALGLTIIFTVIVLAKIGYIKVNGFSKTINFGMWVMVGYFILNTIGNIASINSIEKMILAPLTILLALIALRLALEK